MPQEAINQPRNDLGVMLNPGGGSGLGKPALLFVRWAADNGCFSQGERFDAGDWLEWLASLRRYRERCLFAVAPDVIRDAEATLARSLPYLPTIRQLGYPAAFVTQDDCRSEMVPWDSLDVLFVGGSDEWKLGEASYELVAEAKWRGKWVHMGRVNSFRRLQACQVSSINSADGTYLKFGPDVNLPKLWRWLDQVNAQGVLESAS